MQTSTAIRQEETSPGRSRQSEDHLIVDAAKSGNGEAFGVLAATYRKRILHLVRNITGNLDDAEDVTQQALLKAFLNVRGFRGTCSFSTWLTRIAINEALMWRRRQRVRSEVSLQGDSPFEEMGIVPEITDMRPNPEQRYDKRELCNFAMTAIGKLAPATRSAIEFCGIHEGSTKDFARTQGISLSAAKTRLSRSRNTLRTRFTRLLGARALECVRTSGLAA